MNEAKPIYAYSQKIWHFVLLYITTFTLYFFYWYYQNSKHLYEHNNMPVRYGWRTLGLIVPIVNIYFTWQLIADVKKFGDKAGVQTYPAGWLTFIIILCLVLFRLPDIFGIPDPYAFLGFASVFPLILVQKTLNLYWQKEQPNLPERERLNWVEVLICCIGGILLILSLIGAFMPIKE